jgi:SPP1 gp7 family putative phage head morphogenesis protein
VLKGVMLDGMQELATTTGLSFQLPDVRAANWFNNYVLQFSEKEGTLITQPTKDQISRLLQQAKLEGWSVREIEKQLGATFDRFLGQEPELSEEEQAWFRERNVPYRLENISRSETIRAGNAGGFQMMKQWGVPQHEWLATMDDRVRADHADVNGHIVNVGDPFDVGGVKMLYPGDPSAPPDQTCQCRCTTVPVGMDEM